jgi:hypothetical protein
MSTTVIAQLYGFAETTEMPPSMISENAAADTTGVTEADFTQGEIADGEATGVDPAQENPASVADDPAIAPDTQSPGVDPDLRLYRKRTIGLLRRYLRLSIEVGRLPSLLGREFFRTRVTSYGASTFEDAVIFVHDVERGLEKLTEFDKKLIAKIVFQEYSHEEAARLLGCGLRHISRCYVEALDRVSENFLKRKLLLRLPCTKPEPEKSCQGGKADESQLSGTKQAENKS